MASRVEREINMLRDRKDYPSDLAEHEWDSIKDLIPQAKPGGRPRTIDVRHVVDAIFYLNRSGCAWRYLPVNFPKWQTVYEYFCKWSESGVLRLICANLAERARLKEGYSSAPATVIIDSQSVRAHFGEDRGYDGFKKVRGRKRHILVDTLGIIHGLKVSAANLQDAREGIEMIQKADTIMRKRPVSALYADGSYRESFAWRLHQNFGFWPVFVKSKVLKDRVKWNKRLLVSNLKPKRWIVERTFAWFNHYRRLARDFERKVNHSEAMIHLAMVRMLLKKLAPS